MRRPLIYCALALTGGCNQYDLYRVAGFEQATFSNEADILFVIDNSSSMTDETEALAVNFGVFIEALASEEGGTPSTDDLSDAVSNYIRYVSDRGSILDYQLGVTTTSIDNPNDAPGARGELVGDPYVVTSEEDVIAAFTENMVCEATCWKECVGDDADDCISTDPGYDPDNLTEISTDYLNDLCGSDAWNNAAQNECGSGTEEPIESALMALCRAVESPPDFCFDVHSDLESGDAGSNAGFLREGATVLIVMLTDEGDHSRRMTSGETLPEPYLELFDQFGLSYRFATFGPPYAPNTTDYGCIGGAEPWAVQRMYELSQLTGGFYRWLWGQDTDSAGACTYAAEDFGSHLQELGDLLIALLSVFPLQAIPDPATIQVFVDDVEVAPAEFSADGLVIVDGWSYDPSENAVEFHNEAIPDYNADVRIYYLPLEGMPRELPF